MRTLHLSVQLDSEKPLAAWPVEVTEAPPWEALLALHLRPFRAAQLLRRPLPRPLLSATRSKSI